ncbi:hypothetical protein [Salsuginibacillus kocurii]|uniref:hypothetical protein n=1 Tax=Salsuginibacillus kocurii TaxID=427078 RepID=UPI00036FB149|nr:hypothetical protein [Salsuginibacillus kocurii]
MIKKLKSAWILVLGAILGGISSAYIGDDVSFGFELLFNFLLFSGFSMLTIYILKKGSESIYNGVNKINQKYKTLKEKARLYDEYIEREKNNIKYLGPPYTNGVMELSEEQKSIIINDLNKFEREFSPSADQTEITVHWLTSRYNSKHPEFPINGDTVKYLLGYKPKDPEQVKREAELDLHVYKKIRELLEHEMMMDFLKDLDLSIQPFPFAYVKMVYTFSQTEDNPEYKFMDKELDEIRIKLINSLKILDSLLGVNSEGMGDGVRYIITKNNMSHEERLDITNKINEATFNAWEDYKLFIELGRVKFGLEYSKIGQA